MNTSMKLCSLMLLVLFTLPSAFASDVYLYVTRHGKTMFNTTHRVQGWSDTPLTKAGIEVAKQLGQGLKDVHFISAYSSDLGRARQTARIILETKGQKLRINELESLREQNFGGFEGDLDPNMWNPAAKQLGYQSDKALQHAMLTGKIKLTQIMDAFAAVDKLGEAENYQQVKMRMENALTLIAQSAQKQGGGNVLVVSHGIAILAMIQDMTNVPILKPLENASVTKIRYTDDGQFIVESVGDMMYVEKGKK